MNRRSQIRSVVQEPPLLLLGGSEVAGLRVQLLRAGPQRAQLLFPQCGAHPGSQAGGRIKEDLRREARWQRCTLALTAAGSL